MAVLEKGLAARLASASKPRTVGDLLVAVAALEEAVDLDATVELTETGSLRLGLVVMEVDALELVGRALNAIAGECIDFIESTDGAATDGTPAPQQRGGPDHNSNE